MIRKSYLSDIDRIMSIWLEANISAHPFISADYWESNYEDVKQAIQKAEIYVYEYKNQVCGFIGLLDRYIAGLFIEQNSQSRGIGTELLLYVKKLKQKLSLSVYLKNTKAVNFYKKHGFVIEGEKMDENTKQIEYTMLWERGAGEINEI